MGFIVFLIATIAVVVCAIGIAIVLRGDNEP